MKKNLLKEVHDFQVGEVVHAMLGPCNFTKFAVTKIEGMFVDLVEIGGQNRIIRGEQFTIKPLSEKFGIGLYWNDQEKEMIDSNTLSQMVCEANKKLKEEEEAEQTKIKQDEKLAEQYKQKYSFLNWYIPGTFISLTEVAKNVRLYLKHEFPTKKFNVRKDTHDTIIINCKENSSELIEKVRQIAQIFCNHNRDYSGDHWDYNPTVFNNCFGGATYIFVD